MRQSPVRAIRRIPGDPGLSQALYGPEARPMSGPDVLAALNSIREESLAEGINPRAYFQQAGLHSATQQRYAPLHFPQAPLALSAPIPVSLPLGPTPQAATLTVSTEISTLSSQPAQPDIPVEQPIRPGSPLMHTTTTVGEVAARPASPLMPKPTVPARPASPRPNPARVEARAGASPVTKEIETEVPAPVQFVEAEASGRPRSRGSPIAVPQLISQVPMPTLVRPVAMVPLTSPNQPGAQISRPYNQSAVGQTVPGATPNAPLANTASTGFATYGQTVPAPVKAEVSPATMSNPPEAAGATVIPTLHPSPPIVPTRPTSPIVRPVSPKPIAPTTTIPILLAAPTKAAAKGVIPIIPTIRPNIQPAAPLQPRPAIPVVPVAPIGPAAVPIIPIKPTSPVVAAAIPVLPIKPISPVVAPNQAAPATVLKPITPLMPVGAPIRSVTPTVGAASPAVNVPAPLKPITPLMPAGAPAVMPIKPITPAVGPVTPTIRPVSPSLPPLVPIEQPQPAKPAVTGQLAPLAPIRPLAPIVPNKSLAMPAVPPKPISPVVGRGQPAPLLPQHISGKAGVPPTIGLNLAPVTIPLSRSNKIIGLNIPTVNTGGFNMPAIGTIEGTALKPMIPAVGTNGIVTPAQQLSSTVILPRFSTQLVALPSQLSAKPRAAAPSVKLMPQEAAEAIDWSQVLPDRSKGYTVNQLRGFLASIKLPTSGRKEQLYKALIDAHNNKLI